MNYTYFTYDYTPSTTQFYCSYTAVASIVCLSAEVFSQSPFQSLCPSGDCAHDCLNLERLYQTQPRGANQPLYGYPGTVLLYNICSSLGWIANALASGYATREQAARIEPYFRNVNTTTAFRATDAVSHCLLSSCDSARYPDYCTSSCSANYLITNATTPSWDGQYNCLTALCSSSGGLPLANQDIVGLGVSGCFRLSKTKFC